jgi:hypothetical protein
MSHPLTGISSACSDVNVTSTGIVRNELIPVNETVKKAAHRQLVPMNVRLNDAFMFSEYVAARVNLHGC